MAEELFQIGEVAKFKPVSYEPVHNGYHVLGERVGAAFSDGMKLK